MAWAADYASVSRRLRQAETQDAKVRILRELHADSTIDEELRESLAGLLEGYSYAITFYQAERMIEVRAFAEQASKASPETQAAGQKAKKIKENPLYRDPGDKEESNWFAKGFEKIGEVIQKWLEALFNRNSNPNIEGPNISGAFSWLRILLWVFFGAVVLGFIYFAFRHFSWKKGLERKAVAMLGEDEPELSRDEYLVEADRLTQEGKYREAVRYLYLACLLLFDENGVARFMRGQTNWEHLRRIRDSAKLPHDLDFEPATRKFDVVWYGMHVQGVPDVEAMRGWYVEVSDRLRRQAA